MDLKLTLLLLSLLLFAYRIERSHKEVSTSQTGSRRGIPQETPTTSSLVAGMSIEELRLYSQIPAEIILETSDGVATSIVGEAGNAVYFTREQFVAWLHLPFPLLVKQFFHFTRAPPPLIHPNIFWSLMGCSVLNSLYQLVISLVEICFIYTLKLGIRGHLSMSAHSPRLQFVSGLPDSSKTEVKGVVLVKGLCYETHGSPRLPFDLNQSLSFLGLYLFLF